MSDAATRGALAIGAVAHGVAALGFAALAALWPWLDPGSTPLFRGGASLIGAGLALVLGLLGVALAGFAAARGPRDAAWAAWAAGGLLLLSCWPLGLLVLGLLARDRHGMLSAVAEDGRSS